MPFKNQEEVALLPIQKLIMNSHQNRNSIMEYQIPCNLSNRQSDFLPFFPKLQLEHNHFP